MNTLPNIKKTAPFPDQEIPASSDDLNDAALELENATLQDDQDMNLDDALDDDNENPVSHTLIDAAENSGPEYKSAAEQLRGEAEEDGER